MNIAATTITAISAAEGAEQRLLDRGAAAGAAGTSGRDVAGPGHGERAAGLVEPGAGHGRVAGPPPTSVPVQRRRAAAAQADVVEDGRWPG